MNGGNATGWQNNSFGSDDSAAKIEPKTGNKPIERFMATYDNPFSRHWNSKSYERYIATRIPKDYIPADARHLDVIIDMTKQDKEINFRETGTHDLAIPWP